MEVLQRQYHRCVNNGITLKPASKFQQGGRKIETVCKYWVQGRCRLGEICRFQHPRIAGDEHKSGGKGLKPAIAIDQVCKYWVQGRCCLGENCKFQHPSTVGDGQLSLRSKGPIAQLACPSEAENNGKLQHPCTVGNGHIFLHSKLQGHSAAVTGLVCPSDPSETESPDINRVLYTGSKDGTIRIWDYLSGKCTNVINLGAEVGSLLSVGPWIFVGLPNTVKAYNLKTQTELTLTAPTQFEQVYCLAVGWDFLSTAGNYMLAGTQKGTIMAWKGSTSEPAILEGHTLPVLSMVVGAKKLYSASMDCSVRVWDLNKLECIQKLEGHTSPVTSVICWDGFLLSCSLDNTIKVWGIATEGGKIELMYTHQEKNGLLCLAGLHDEEKKPILLCSHKDNSVCAYDLPSFSDRGKMILQKEVGAIQTVKDFIFTGDETGQVSIFKLLAGPA